MTITTLAIDTCLEALSVGIGEGAEVTVHSRHIGVGHAEHLAPLVSELLATANLCPDDIDRVVSTVGPGSFMGTRVGLSFAAGFAAARKIPTLPITTLEAIWLSAPAGASGAVLIDARRGQVYGQVFGVQPSAPFLLDLADARTRLDEELGDTPVLLGSGVQALWPKQDAPAFIYPDPERLLRAAEKIAPAPLRPLYLRPPDAVPMAARR